MINLQEDPLCGRQVSVAPPASEEEETEFDPTEVTGPVSWVTGASAPGLGRGPGQMSRGPGETTHVHTQQRPHRGQGKAELHARKCTPHRQGSPMGRVTPQVRAKQHGTRRNNKLAWSRNGALWGSGLRHSLRVRGPAAL
ncbi:unnamed protein product [Lota lota]